MWPYICELDNGSMHGKSYDVLDHDHGQDPIWSVELIERSTGLVIRMGLREMVLLKAVENEWEVTLTSQNFSLNDRVELVDACGRRSPWTYQVR